MLHRNPIFIRFCRAELRLKKAGFWYLLVLITTAFTVAIIYAPQVVHGRDSMVAARAALLPVMIIQGIILLFMGTGNVASGITREKVDNVLNYARLTPLPTRDKILGYLFGLPVRQYVLFAITLPFLAFILIVGRIPPGAFLPYYLILFSSTLLYHLTGMVAGMISRRWRWSARISQGLIILLYFVLPQLSHLGLVFLEFLTVRPVFAEKILPVIGASSNIKMDEIGFMAGQSVPFFTMEISGTLFSFVIQAGLIVLLTAIVARKWKADTVPAFSKPLALATFLVLIVMSLGNIWPNLTLSDNALRIFQASGPTAGARLAVTALPLVLALTTTLLAFCLMLPALPDPMQFRHGRIRAERLRRERLSLWEDAAGGYPFTSLLFLAQLILLAVVFFTLRLTGAFAAAGSQPLQGTWLIAACGLSLFYFQGVKEGFGTGRVALFVLLGWALPILAAILVIAIDQNQGNTALLVAALSPITLLPFAAVQLVPPEILAEAPVQFHRPLAVGLLSLTTLTAWLHWRLDKRRR
ncbi:MAG: hypothetical protein ACP5I4_12315 [Oceanipulchritudo sp.]